MRYLDAYGQWAGNPKGHPPDFDRCAKAVYRPHQWVASQCSRTATHEPDPKGKPTTCWQHQGKKQ